MLNYIMSFNTYEEFKKALKFGLIKPKEHDYYVILKAGGSLPNGTPITNNHKLVYTGGSYETIGKTIFI